MSEPAAKQRQSIDLDEFERRLRAPSPAARSEEDPLVELARLVGGGAPFTAPAAGLPRATYQPRVVPQRDWQPEEAVPQAPAVVFDLDPQHVAEPAEPMQFLADPASSFDDEEFAARDSTEIDEDRPPRSRRALYLTGGVLAFVLVGIAVTFATRGHAPDGGEAPTIKAATGPTKVQPATAADVNGADQGGALLNRSGADKVSSTRVVDNQEQPVDLRTLQSQRPVADNAANGAQPQATTTDAAASAAATTSYFPEPKRVHTVSVRPDGTIIADELSPSARSLVASNDPSALSRPAAGATSAANQTVTTDVQLPTARPTTPKTTARVVTTPKPSAGAADTASGTPSIAPAIALHSAPPAPAAPPNPMRIAVATAPGGGGRIQAAPASLGGGYVVQLAAPASEQEAQEAVVRLEKKFAAELSGHHTTVEKADSNGHTVYRVRVVGLASDDANILCSRLKASGGACFVARN